MKTIIVMRHAKAESNSPTDNDFDRRLHKKGKLTAQNTAQKYKELKLIPDLIVTSPVIRAMSTAEIFAVFFGLKNAILSLNYLYQRLYTFNEIVNDAAAFKNDSNTMLIVGHNPTLSYLLQQINSENNEILRTSSAIVFDFDVDNWSEVNASNSIRRCFIDRED